MPSFLFQDLISDVFHAAGALLFLTSTFDIIAEHRQQQTMEKATQTQQVSPVLPGGWSVGLWEQRQARLLAQEILKLAELFESIERARCEQRCPPTSLVYKRASPSLQRLFSQLDDAEECRLSPLSPPVEQEKTTPPKIIPIFSVGTQAQVGASEPNTQ